MALTLGLIYPFIVARQREFYVDNSRLGRSPFRLTLPTWPVYRIYGAGRAGRAGVARALALSVVAGAVLAGRRRPSTIRRCRRGVALAVLIAYAGVGVLYVAVRTAFENLAWNHTHARRPSLREPPAHRPDAAIYVTNIALIAMTVRAVRAVGAGAAGALPRRLARPCCPAVRCCRKPTPRPATRRPTGAELSDAMDLDFGL